MLQFNNTFLCFVVGCCIFFPFANIIIIYNNVIGSKTNKFAKTHSFFNQTLYKFYMLASFYVFFFISIWLFGELETRKKKCEGESH